MPAALTTYQKLCTEFYDLESHPDNAKSLSFYMEYAKLAHGPILEPMCGTGRFIIPMLQTGFDIEGFDASTYMLDALKQKYAQVSEQEPPVWQQFVQDFTSHKRYKLIFVPYGSWGLITNKEDSKKSLQIMHEHLAPSGKLVLEIETVSSVPQPTGIWRRGINTRADGSKIAINTFATYDESTQIYRAQCHYESLEHNTVVATESEDFQMYLYQFDEMDQLLHDAGFRDIKKFNKYSHEHALDPKTPILVYEAIK